MSLRTVHAEERKKPVARRHGDLLVGACCSLELIPSEVRHPDEVLNSRGLEMYYGRSVPCSLCGERLLDENGWPVEVLDDSE